MTKTQLKNIQNLISIYKEKYYPLMRNFYGAFINQDEFNYYKSSKNPISCPAETVKMIGREKLEKLEAEFKEIYFDKGNETFKIIIEVYKDINDSKEEKAIFGESGGVFSNLSSVNSLVRGDRSYGKTRIIDEGEKKSKFFYAYLCNQKRYDEALFLSMLISLMSIFNYSYYRNQSFAEDIKYFKVPDFYKNFADYQADAYAEVYIPYFMKCDLFGEKPKKMFKILFLNSLNQGRKVDTKTCFNYAKKVCTKAQKITLFNKSEYSKYINFDLISMDYFESDPALLDEILVNGIITTSSIQTAIEKEPTRFLELAAKSLNRLLYKSFSATKFKRYADRIKYLAHGQLPSIEKLNENVQALMLQYQLEET